MVGALGYAVGLGKRAARSACSWGSVIVVGRCAKLRADIVDDWISGALRGNTDGGVGSWAILTVGGEGNQENQDNRLE